MDSEWINIFKSIEMVGKMKRWFRILLLICTLALVFCQSNIEADTEKTSEKNSSAKITFIELGSVSCIPCKAMQPVIKSVEEKYGDQINVVFYDVWKPDQKKYAQEYGIKLIPTQVFINNEGKEIFRHEGFFPEKEIDSLLQKHGLKPKVAL
jgi:thioredoxin 1